MRKHSKPSWNSGAPAILKVGHPLLLSLIILILMGQPFCAAQSRAYDQQLFQAVGKGDLGAVRVLLANGADLEAKDERGDTPVMVAVGNKNIAMIKLLLEKGANISARNNYEETALIEAASSMDPDMLRILLSGDPDIKEKNAALFEAAKSSPVILQMTDAPATPGEHNEHAPTVAPEPPWVTNVRLLLDSGANFEARDEEGDTPLIQAASYGQTEIFELLLARGAKINVRDKQGMTPLMAAACECALATMNSTNDIVRILLDKGVDVNAQTHDGTTVLMNAAAGFGDVAIVKLLLDHGANPTARNKHGKTALALAAQGNRQDKVLLLKAAMAKGR